MIEVVIQKHQFSSWGGRIKQAFLAKVILHKGPKSLVVWSDSSWNGEQNPPQAARDYAKNLAELLELEIYEG